MPLPNWLLVVMVPAMLLVEVVLRPETAPSCHLLGTTLVKAWHNEEATISGVTS